jgi:hypothetical protein
MGNDKIFIFSRKGDILKKQYNIKIKKEMKPQVKGSS